MTKAGLLDPVGEKRGRYNQPTPALTRAWHTIPRATAEPTDDPYEHAQPQHPGLGA